VAKAYQVKQVLKAIERLAPHGGGVEVEKNVEE
jgi:hypothetical protein